MGKIIAAIALFVVLSLTLVISCYWCFDKIATKAKEIGLSLPSLWLDFTLVSLAIVISVATLVTLLTWELGEKHVL
jgi:hypothetical protein